MKKILIITFIVFTPFIYSQDEGLDRLEKRLQGTTGVSPTLEKIKANTDEIKQENSVFKTRDNIKAISISSSIEEAFKNNIYEKKRRFERGLIEIELKNARDNFYFPKLDLTLSTDPHNVRNIYKDSSLGEGTSKTPGATLGLEFKEYKVFNWGKDYIDYINSQETYARNKQQLKESKRSLRFDVIKQYFTLAAIKNIKNINQNRLRQSSFIYRLNKEKLGLKKIQNSEYLLSKTDYVTSQNNFQKAIIEEAKEEEKLSHILGDEAHYGYRPVETLKFIPITIKEENAYKIALEKSPLVLDKKLSLDTSNRLHQKVLKENLPLPTFSVSLGAYHHGFSSGPTFDSYTTTDSNNRNIELRASLNMSWSLIGEGGILNSRNSQKAYLQKRISELDYIDSKKQLKTEIKTLYEQLRQYEFINSALEVRSKSARDAYDATLDSYISGKVPYTSLRIALEDLTQARVDEELMKLYHLIYKIELSELIGLDDLPGENFEKIGVR